jgi:AcrR family transcriptional regulator
MRVRTEAKRQDILGIAGQMFLTRGYSNVTMASIAAALGGSKGTLYGYFTSKEELFTAFMEETGEEAFRSLAPDVDDDDSAVDALKRFGLQYLSILLKPEIIAIIRLVIAEAPRSPDLAAFFHRQGLARVMVIFEALFETLSAQGKLAVPSAARAALEFKGLCEAGLYEPLLLAGRQTPDRAEMAAGVAAATGAICRLYVVPT